MLKALELRGRMEQVDALVAQGNSIMAATARVGVAVASYTLWLAEHGNQVPIAVDRLSHLQDENARLRRALAELSAQLDTTKRTGPDGVACKTAA